MVGVISDHNFWKMVDATSDHNFWKMVGATSDHNFWKMVVSLQTTVSRVTSDYHCRLIGEVASDHLFL